MEPAINQTRYPIEAVWVIKSTLASFLVLIFFVIIMFLSGPDSEMIAYFLISLIYVPGNLIYSFLRRKTFTYSLNDEFLTLGQGILSKQQRNIPYGVIQNVLVKQDLFDRIFGLGALIVENASQNGAAADGTTKIFGMTVTSRSKQIETAGFTGNRVTIPGLKIGNAQALREAMLGKMKDHPIHDNESGL